MGMGSAIGMVLVAAVAAGPTESVETRDRELARRVQSLVAKINENPDALHSEVTSTGIDLVQLGLPALRHGALELMVSDDRDTRKRGEFVLYGILLNELGEPKWSGGRRNEKRCRELWAELGGYERDMPEPERRKCYETWKAWLATVDQLTPRRDPNRLRPPQVDPPTTTAR